MDNTETRKGQVLVERATGERKWKPFSADGCTSILAIALTFALTAAEDQAEIGENTSGHVVLAIVSYSRHYMGCTLHMMLPGGS